MWHTYTHKNSQKCQFILMLGIKYQFLLYDFESQNKIKRNKIGKRSESRESVGPIWIEKQLLFQCSMSFRMTMMMILYIPSTIHSSIVLFLLRIWTFFCFSYCEFSFLNILTGKLIRGINLWSLRWEGKERSSQIGLHFLRIAFPFCTIIDLI